MPRFSVVAESDQATYNGSTGVDLAPYRALIAEMIGELDKPPARAGYSLWHRVDLDGSETGRATRRRLTTAAAEANQHVLFHPKSTEQSVIVCLRPAPVAKNGKVESK